MGRRPPPRRAFPRPVTLARWSISIGALAAVWLGLNYRLLVDYFEAKSQRNVEKLAVLQLEERYGSLQRQKRELESWGFDSLRTIRERFGFIEPGERVLIVEEAPPEEAGPPPDAPPDPSEPGERDEPTGNRGH